MGTKIFSLLLIFAILYIGGIFLFPELSDTYGSKKINNSIRDFKAKIDSDSANFWSGWAIIDKVTNIAKPYIDGSKEVTNQLKTTIETKTEQAKQAADSVEKAYKAIEWAKTDVEKLTKFWTGQ